MQKYSLFSFVHESLNRVYLAGFLALAPVAFANYAPQLTVLNYKLIPLLYIILTIIYPQPGQLSNPGSWQLRLAQENVHQTT
uniref:Uncharacterized protein n=1 Tax=Strigamia maritima TaxID=126957 RepID=T1JJB1_STRMM